MNTLTSAQELVRQIRFETGLSQAELSRRARLPRAVMNAYERGTRQPSVAAMLRIAWAGGYELTLTPRSTPVDPHRASKIIEQVVGLAEALPYRPREFDYAKLPPVRDENAASSG